MDFERWIDNRHKSDSYAYFNQGEAYYLARNTNILDRKKYIFLEGLGVVENPFGANHKLPSGHFKKIVDQKVMYQLGNGVKFSQEQDLDQYFDDPFDEVMIDLGIEASKKSEAWIMAFKQDGQLKFTMLPPEQLTPIWDEYGKLAMMLRSFYDGDFHWVYAYDEMNITQYRKKSTDKGFKLFATHGHWTEYSEFNGEQIGEPIEHGFGKVPFVPLYNNRDHTCDLHNIKTLIDTYDIINSDFANNIDDMQDAFFTLKGYTGDGKNLGEFMRQLKMYKAVPVSDDGAVESHQLQIPTEARKIFLERIEKDIYKFSMAVDLSNASGGSITNVYIKSMFADLDLKCDQFESEVRKFIKKLVNFINASENTNYTYDCSFTREMIVNSNEVVDNIVKLSGVISNKTMRELIPFSIDLEQEEERIMEQQGEITLGQANSVMENNDMESSVENTNEMIDQNTLTIGETPMINNQTKIAEVSLNGSQISSLLEVITNFKQGIIDRQSAIAIVIAAFPFNEQEAERIVGQ